MRGISEYVSATLLALIVLGLGALVVSKIIEDAQLAARLAENRLVEIKVEAKQDIDIVMTYIDTSDVLHVVVATAGSPVRIEALYINGILWNGKCVIHLTSGEVYSGPPVTIPYYMAAHIECSLPPGTSIARVKLVYPGGEAYASAKRV